MWGQVARQDLPSIARHAKVFAQQGLGRAGAKADENFRLDHVKFCVEPGSAGLDFGLARLFVDAALASLRSRPLEVFDNIRYVNFRAVDSNFDKNFFVQSSGRTDERMSALILTVARLLADKHDSGLRRSFAEDCLGRGLPEVASFAAPGDALENGQSWRVGDQIGSGLPMTVGPFGGTDGGHFW